MGLWGSGFSLGFLGVGFFWVLGGLKEEPWRARAGGFCMVTACGNTPRRQRASRGAESMPSKHHPMPLCSSFGFRV